MRVTLLGTGQLHPADRVQCGTLTHLPDHTPGERRATVRTIRERFAGNVTVARDVERFSTR